MAALAPHMAVALAVVRGGGAGAVHYVHRDENPTAIGPKPLAGEWRGTGLHGRTLCGKLGPPNRYQQPKWTRVHRQFSRGAKVCQACAAHASSVGAVLDFSDYSKGGL